MEVFRLNFATIIALR